VAVDEDGRHQPSRNGIPPPRDTSDEPRDNLVTSFSFASLDLIKWARKVPTTRCSTTPRRTAKDKEHEPRTVIPS
jgi:hypothetical protein